MAAMTPYELLVLRAKRYKETVKSMWKAQLTILILSICAYVLLLLSGLAAIIYEFEGILFLGLIPIFIIALVAYVFQWIFCNRVGDWVYYAPQEDQKQVGRIHKSLLTILITGIVSGVISGITDAFTPYLNLSLEEAQTFVLVTGLISLIIAAINLIAIIMQIVGLVKLSKSTTLPEKAKRGAKSIIIYYIVIFALLIVGLLLLLIGAHCSTTNELLGGIFALISLSILGIGGIASMVFYYRGWWLISKSELPVIQEETRLEHDTENTLTL